MVGIEESCYDKVVTSTLDRISFTATAVSRYLTLLRNQPHFVSVALLFHVVLSALGSSEQPQ